MIITDEHITEFQALYKKRYGTDISKEEALEVGLRLIRLMEIVLKETAKQPTSNITNNEPTEHQHP